MEETSRTCIVVPIRVALLLLVRASACFLGDISDDEVIVVGGLGSARRFWLRWFFRGLSLPCSGLLSTS